MRAHNRNVIAGAVLSAALLAGCVNGQISDMSTPSQVNVRQVRLKETLKTERLDVYNFDQDRVAMISVDYAKTHRGDMTLTVAYPPGSPQKEAEIRRGGERYRQAFLKRGIRDLDIDYVPVQGSAYAGEAVVSWPALSALPPEGCTRIPGYQGADTLDDVAAYKIGCETETAFSKMVADPSDLRGKSGAPVDDSRRHGAVVEKYKSGTPNAPMQGMTASDIGGGG